MYDPLGVAYQGYGDGSYAPGVTEPETAPYQVAHRLIQAHSKVYRMYKQEFAAQNGKYPSYGVICKLTSSLSALSSSSSLSSSPTMLFS